MIMRGAPIYSEALRGQRLTLQGPAAEEASDMCPILPLHALTCAVSELLANRNWNNLASHLNGVVTLVEYGGLESLRSREARNHFYTYRPMQAAFSFLHVHAHFLADSRWNKPSWEHEAELSRTLSRLC